MFAGNEDMHNSLDEFKFRPNRIIDYRVNCIERIIINVSTFTRLLLLRSIFFKNAGSKDMHNILDGFKFRPDRTIDYNVSCH